MSTHALFGDFQKVRGPGAKLQQTETRGSVKTAWVGAKGLRRDGPGTDKGSEAWLARRGSSQEEHTVNSLGWAERHGNRAGVADSLAWREGGKVGCRTRVWTRQQTEARQDKLVRGQLGLAQGGKMTRPEAQGQGQSQGAQK